MNLQDVETAGRELGIANVVMAAKVWPKGYDVADAAPESLEELSAMFKRDRRIAVLKGFSDRTIYAEPDQNWAFRAWHDWTHLQGRFPFTPAGERATAAQQVRDLVRVYGRHLNTVHMAAVLLCEVVGQTDYQLLTGEFPEDQRQFTLDRATTFYHQAAELVRKNAHVYGQDGW